MSSEPFFSVIIATWRRTQFLKAAVDSVLHQSLDPSQYEVVLSKGVVDDSLEEYCRARGVRVLWEESWDLGRRIERALDSTHGEVLVFMDDDDEFAPTKLETLADAFRRWPGLAYYHHGVSVIGEHGEALSEARTPHLVRNHSGSTGPILFPPGSAWDRYRTLEPLDPSWNTSSVAVRRDVLLAHRPVLSELAFLVGRMAYLVALSENRPIVLDPRPLTRYRYHSANSSGMGGRSSLGSAGVAELTNRLHTIAVRQLRDLELLAGLVRRAGQPQIAAQIEGRLPVLRLFATLRDPQVSRSNVLRRWGEMIHRQGPWAGESPWGGPLASTAVVHSLLAAYLASPRLGAAAYVRLREFRRPVAS